MKSSCKACGLEYTTVPVIGPDGVQPLFKSGKDVGKPRTELKRLCACRNMAFKVEISPTKSQVVWLERCGGAARWIYNWVLREWKKDQRVSPFRVERLAKRLGFPNPLALRKLYEGKFPERKDPSRIDWNNRLGSFRKKYPHHDWLDQVGSYAIREACADAVDAFKDWMSGKTGYPRFQKREHEVSFHLDQPASILETVRHAYGDTVRVSCPSKAPEWIQTEFKTRRTMWLPALKWDAKTKSHVGTPGYSLVGVSFSRKAGRWFVSISAVVPPLQRRGLTGLNLGVDLGLRGPNSAVDSDGRTYGHPSVKPALEKLRYRLARLEKVKARKLGPDRRDRSKKKSRSWESVVEKIRDLHYRVECIQRNARHQITSRIAHKGAPTITVEDLNVKQMTGADSTQGTKQKKGWLSLGPGEVRVQLTYKAKWRGSVVRTELPQYTSRQCSKCRMVGPKLRGEHFVCRNCGKGIHEMNPALATSGPGGRVPCHHRDRNAAENLRSPELGRKARQAAWTERQAKKASQDASPAGGFRRDASVEPALGRERIGEGCAPHSGAAGDETGSKSLDLVSGPPSFHGSRRQTGSGKTSRKARGARGGQPLKDGAGSLRKETGQPALTFSQTTDARERLNGAQEAVISRTSLRTFEGVPIEPRNPDPGSGGQPSVASRSQSGVEKVSEGSDVT